jgi:hypothetical protein
MGVDMNAVATQVAFVQVGDSKNVSELIRSNAPQYWGYMKRHADLQPVRKYLQYEGAVAGDPHLGNFGPIPVTTVQGRRAMRFVNIDFDDSGHGPFVLDYIRYAIAIKAQSSDSKRRVLQEAYLAGLSGKAIAAPKQVQQYLAMKVSSYDEMASSYMTKHTIQSKFKLKPGSIEPYTAKIKPAAIHALFPHAKVMDLACRVEARGGSENDIRIWALVEDRDGLRRIMELKQYAAPGVGSYRPQPAVKQWLAEIRSAFWPGLTGAEYDLITLGGKLFWIREKRVCLINIPYTKQSKHDRDFVVALAAYDANILGLAHGTQPTAGDYTKAIKNDPEEFHRTTKEVGEAYLQLARRALSS